MNFASLRACAAALGDGGAGLNMAMAADCTIRYFATAARFNRTARLLRDCTANARLLHDCCTTAARCDSSLHDCYTTARCDSSLTTAALTIPTSLVHCYHIASPLLSHHKSTAALTCPHRCYHITSPRLSHHKSTAVTSQSPLLH